MEPGESLDEGPRHLARPAGLDLAGQELPGLLLGEPGEVLVPGVGPPPLLRRVARQVARVDLQDEPALGEESIGPVQLCDVQRIFARELAPLGLELIPILQGLAQLAGDESRVVVVPGGQERAVGRGGISPLTRARGPRAAGVVALFGDLLEEPALGVPARLQAPHLVGGGDELRGELLHLGVGPDRLSGDHSVVSGTSQGMPVHRPEQDGPVGLPRLVDRDVERLTPGDFQVGLLLDLGTDIVTPSLERLIVQDRRLPQRGDRGE